MKRYYVYLHKRKDNDVIFYVGKGTNKRMSDVSRSKAWKDIVQEADGFIPEIYKDNLTEDEAFELECKLISNPPNDWKLVNEPPAKPIDYNQDWHQLFTYDETSKSCLRWKYSKYPKRIGQEVGSYHTCGSTSYWNVTINGRVHKIHRIIWVMFNDKLGNKDLINHIDTDSGNNKISNLELSNPMHNSCNTKLQIKLDNDPDGYLREHCAKHTIKGIQYIYYFVQVSISRYGKHLYKSFSYKKCGSKEKAWEIARICRDIALISFDEANSTNYDKYLIDTDRNLYISEHKEIRKSGKIVTIYRVTVKGYPSKEFSDAKYGSIEAAQDFAINYRNNLINKENK